MCDKKAWRPHITPLHPIPTDLQPTGKPVNKVDAILFDIYGTLFISASGDISLTQMASGRWNKSAAQLLQKYHIEITPTSLKQTLFNTIAQRHQELKACGTKYPEVEIDRVWMQVLGWEDMARVREFAIEYELIANPVYPMPHLKSTLEAFRNAQIPMGIISNAQFYTPCLFDYFLGAKVEALGFPKDLTIYSFQTGHGKPSPYLFQLARDRLQAHGLTQERVLFVGNDMLNDIYPASQAGFQTALFAGDQRSLRLRPDDPRCTKIEPDIVITDLAQLTNHILLTSKSHS